MGPTHFALATQLQGLTHFAPADMTGQDSEVQNSVIVPYSMLIWLKKSTAAGKEEEDNKQVVRSAANACGTCPFALVSLQVAKKFRFAFGPISFRRSIVSLRKKYHRVACCIVSILSPKSK